MFHGKRLLSNRSNSVNTTKLSLLQIARKIPDNESAEKSFIKQRWKDSVEYTHCKSKRASDRKKAENEHSVATTAVNTLAPKRAH